MTIFDIHLLAKLTPREDYTWSGSTPLPEGLAVRVSAWLDLHLRSDSLGTSVFLRLPDRSLWFANLAEDSFLDAANRKCYYAVVGRCGSEPGVEEAVANVMAAARHHVPSRLDAKRESMELERTGQVQPPDALAVRTALLTLALSEPASAVCTGMGTASEILHRLGANQWMFLAAMNVDSVPALTLMDTGLVIARRSTPPPPDVAGFANCAGYDAIDFGDLLTSAASAASRKQLLTRVLDPDASLPMPLTERMLSWLLRNVPDRRAILGLATCEQAGSLARQGCLFDTSDFEALAEKLPRDSKTSRACAGPLNKQGARELFLRIFGKGADGLDQFLTEEESVWWRYLESPDNNAVPSGSGDAELAVLDSLGMMNRLSLSNLCAAVWRRLAPGSSNLSAQISRRLVKAGLPQPAADALAGITELAHAPADSPPDVAGAAWTSAIPKERWCAVAHWALPDGRWRDWWVHSLVNHPASAALREWREDLPPPWDPLLGWLLAAKGYEDAPGRHRFLSAVAHWTHDPHVDPALLAQMVKATGCTPTTIAMEMRAAPNLWLETMRVALPWWLKHGVVDWACLVLAMPVSASSTLLRAGSASAEAAALLDAEEPLPSKVPRDWHTDWTPWLDAAATQENFWKRFALVTTPELVPWLEKTLQESPSGQSAAMVGKAFAKEGRLDEPHVSLMAPSLPLSVLSFQILIWSREHTPEAQVVNTLLFGALASRTPGSLVTWLKRELEGATLPAPMPTEALPVLEGLLPLVHPVQALRFILSEPPLPPESDSALRSALLPVLQDPGVLPPAGNAPMTWREQHPLWFKELAQLDGWRWWAEGSRLQPIPILKH